MPDFPEDAPDTIGPVVEAVFDDLGELAPEPHRQRILNASARLPLLSPWNVGLEVALPPAPAACDASLLLARGDLPPWSVHDPTLLGLAAAADAPSMWWELDSSTDQGPTAANPTGAFVSSRVTEGALDLLLEHVPPGLEAAAAHLADLCRPYFRAGWVGFFPERHVPAVAALIALTPEVARGVLCELAERVSISVDPQSGQARLLLESCDALSVAVAVDATGMSAAALEAGFARRAHAMADGVWEPLLAQDVWSVAAASIPHLLATQGFRAYQTLPSVAVMSGIDHLKLGPLGRLKAYVGFVPYRRDGGPRFADL
jgi:hypothetical protein